MYADGLLLEMLTDADITYALRVTEAATGADLAGAVRALRNDPAVLAAMLEDQRLEPAVLQDPQILLKVSPYFFFSVLLRRARRELRQRTFTAEWLAPRKRLPVFDAPRIAASLEDTARIHYLADLLASFTSVARSPGNRVPPGPTDRGFHELNLDDLRRLRQNAHAAQRFALDRRLGDVALFLAGVFPDSARGSVELDEWEGESQARYRSAARAPEARQCGLRETLDGLAADLHPARKALNFVADRFLQPLRCEWFALGA